ncbi:MAG: non-ribosomal peptide synthetase, partial [Myxococcota bacterium]
MFVWQVLMPLILGGRTHIIGGDMSRDPDALIAELARGQVTVFQTVPALLQAMLDLWEETRPVGCLRWLVPTGDVLPTRLANQWLERFPALPLVNAYGPAECSDDVTLGVIAQPLPADAASCPIGTSVPNLRVSVLDENLALRDQGLVGELFITGMGVGRGYLGDPAHTAERFLPDPHAAVPGARMYRSGDRASRDNRGDLVLHGRVDDQVKIAGVRIELNEVAHSLRLHPQIAEAVALSDTIGAGNPSLLAYCVARNAVSPDIAELRGFMRRHLPEPMMPTFIAVLPRFPLTDNGKIDRKALLSLPRDPQPYRQPVAPRTAAERALHSIWCELLERDAVSIHDNFFDIGGHSLMAAKLRARIRTRLQHVLPLRALFEHPTIAALAGQLPADR